MRKATQVDYSRTYPRIDYPRIDYPRIDYPRIDYPRLDQMGYMGLITTTDGKNETSDDMERLP